MPPSSLSAIPTIPTASSCHGRLCSGSRKTCAAAAAYWWLMRPSWMPNRQEQASPATWRAGMSSCCAPSANFLVLPGCRLGFAVAAPAIAARLGALLGPWAVSGPALAVGAKALADTDWIKRTRKRIAKAANKLDAILSASGLSVIGGTSLFRLAQIPTASALFRHLGHAGIFVRAFPDNASWLRFGLPGNAREWQRLHAAMTSFQNNSQYDN